MAGAGGGAGSRQPMPACRTYATAYTFSSSLGSNFGYACSHSETASGFDRSCIQGGATTVEHWTSKVAFIDEAAAVGVVKLQSATRLGYRTAYEYDAQGRLVRITLQGALYATVDSWDSRGRPLHMVFSGSCAGGTGTNTYDDAARTYTQAIQGGSCASTTKIFYDADMIWTGVDYGDGTTASYTTTARAAVCR